ncbi:hypothetical protein Cva_01290 [Caedimonas varicaedens]|uniref:Lipoprotein n=1 Tax=Caedimonas varicaedens TaxID=1629334 RepID=A0A0K8MDM1_9PROT|nr:hypothetical protein Cva_01290 [Caedimonas varicaedens]
MKAPFSALGLFFVLVGCSGEPSCLSKAQMAELETLKADKDLWDKDSKSLRSFRERYNHVKLSLYDELIEINKSFAPNDSKEQARRHLFIPKDIKSHLDSLSKRKK